MLWLHKLLLSSYLPLSNTKDETCTHWKAYNVCYLIPSRSVCCIFLAAESAFRVNLLTLFDLKNAFSLGKNESHAHSSTQICRITVRFLRASFHSVPSHEGKEIWVESRTFLWKRPRSENWKKKNCPYDVFWPPFLVAEKKNIKVK